MVDTEHMEEDLKYFINDVQIKNATDSQPLVLKPYSYPESFKRYEHRFKDRTPILQGMAKDNKEQVQK